MKTISEIVIPCYEADVTAIVRLERHCQPDARPQRSYEIRFEHYSGRCRPL